MERGFFGRSTMLSSVVGRVGDGDGEGQSLGLLTLEKEWARCFYWRVLADGIVDCNGGKDYEVSVKK